MTDCSHVGESYPFEVLARDLVARILVWGKCFSEARFVAIERVAAVGDGGPTGLRAFLRISDPLRRVRTRALVDEVNRTICVEQLQLIWRGRRGCRFARRVAGWR